MNQTYEARSLDELEKLESHTTKTILLLNRNTPPVQLQLSSTAPPRTPPHRNSAEQIERNKLLAKIRLRERQLSWIQQFKKRMSGYFELVEIWPNYAIKILFTKRFEDSERRELACFLHGNGLNDKWKALTIFQLYNNSWRHDYREWKCRFDQFQQLFDRLAQMQRKRTSRNNNEILHSPQNQYHFYNMKTKSTMYYVDGNVGGGTKDGQNERYFQIFK